MNEEMSDLPQAIAADPDGVQVALRAAHTLWSRGDTAESLKWLRKAAETASDEGADLRSLQLAKAAAELRAKLFGGSEPAPRSGRLGAAANTPVASGALGHGAPLGNPASHGAKPAGAQGSGAFPPSGVEPGEGGSHPIAPSRAETEPPRAASPPSSAPPIEAFAVGASTEESAGAQSSGPVTATQYPSHRPRQRMGLLSTAPGSQRDGTAYASVPSWSAESERRGSSAPPPMPRANLDDYEELEAEPDDEPADDPGSVWSGSGPESWRPAQARSGPPGATPPPLPPRGAFSDDDGDYAQQVEAQAAMLPLEEKRLEQRHLDEDDLDARHREQRNEAEPVSTREPRQAAASLDAEGAAWDEQSRAPSWEHDASASWAPELQQAWGNPSNPGNSSAGTSNFDSGSIEEPPPEPALQSEAARAKLVARVHHQAVRVSFAPDLRVPGQYVVRPLREGEKAAAGERIALLVALEPGVPLV